MEKIKITKEEFDTMYEIDDVSTDKPTNNPEEPQETFTIESIEEIADKELEFDFN